MGINLEEPEAHPLFPVDEDSDSDEIKPVTLIHIARKENGKLLFAPRARQPGELQSLEQIHAEFGGGEYTLIGYNNGRISNRRTVNLSGKSKPLFDEGIVEPPASPITPTLVPPPAGDPMMSMIMMMMQGMMQQQAQAAQSQTQMFIAMMQGTRESSSEEKAAARAELQASVERERINSERQMAMMREMMQASMAGKSGGSGEDFTRGVEFMRSFATQQIETLRATAKDGGDTDWGSILETLGQVMQGVGMLKGTLGGAMPEGAVGIPVPEVVAQ